MAITLYGIDVSYANGALNWSDIANSGQVDFAILRAGYGRNNLDAQFLNNALGCFSNNIPFGIYWFSYALSVNDAENEGNYASNLADNLLQNLGISLTYPIWYDWEYDSDTYAQNQGVTMTNALRTAFAEAFCDACINRGYQSGVYTNPDYLTKGFREVVNDGYPLWLAQWNVSQPSETCSCWQYGITTLSGVQGYFDGDIIGDTYPPFPPIVQKRKMPLWMMLNPNPYY